MQRVFLLLRTGAGGGLDPPHESCDQSHHLSPLRLVSGGRSSPMIPLNSSWPIYQTGDHLICPQGKQAPALSQGSWSLLRSSWLLICPPLPYPVSISLSWEATGRVTWLPRQCSLSIDLGGWRVVFPFLPSLSEKGNQGLNGGKSQP